MPICSTIGHSDPACLFWICEGQRNSPRTHVHSRLIKSVFPAAALVLRDGIRKGCCAASGPRDNDRRVSPAAELVRVCRVLSHLTSDVFQD